MNYEQEKEEVEEGNIKENGVKRNSLEKRRFSYVKWGDAALKEDAEN